MMDSDLPPGGCNSTGHLSTVGYHSLPGRMHHSASTPAGVDGAGAGGNRTPPATPKKGGKMLAVRVQMLDDTISMFQIQSKAFGRVLFDQVCRQLHLLESDYFGLEYQDVNATRYWLDVEKPMCRQVGLSMLEPTLRFCVKFYTPDPARLEEEFTRYLFCLQVKRDLAHGCIQCNENTAALMASYIVQAECGDFVPEDYPDHTYLSGYKFFPGQDSESERRIMENHKKHIGQSPAEADLNLLETARRCELYGIKMHPAKDHENVPLNLAVAHMGIVVFQNYTKINTFSWAKIRKISFKRKKFLIKLHPEGYGYYRDVVEFFFDGRNECKNFWKKCVENHGFFRCSTVPDRPRHRPKVMSRGSSFRYSGRTQKQIVEYVRDNYVKRQTFQRSGSFRARSLRVERAPGLAPSVSAHPLLPLPPGSDAISLEWDKQPHYLEACLVLRGYSAEAAAARARPLPSRAPATAYVSVRDKLTKLYYNEIQQGPEVVTHAEVNHHPTEEDSPLPHRTKTPLLSPESTWSQASSGRGAGARAPSQLPEPADVTPSSPDEDKTVSSASLLLSPKEERTLPLVASTPLVKQCNGVTREPDTSVINGNGNLVSESTNSIDVLSCGESDAGDTLGRSRRNNNSISSSYQGTLRDGTTDRRKRGAHDPLYCIAKQLLMDERTYKRDLQLVTVTWSLRVSSLAGSDCGDAVSSLGRPCLALEPLALRQGAFLAALEKCLAASVHRNDNEDPEYKKIADILLDYLTNAYESYKSYVAACGALVGRVESARRLSAGAAGPCAGFDSSAPLPLSALLLRPLHALHRYAGTANELSQCLEDDCVLQLQDVTRELWADAAEQLRHAENHAAMCQLQRDILGYEKLLVAGREFLRLGCVYKHSSKGLQQRMLFLFSDVLVVCGRGAGGYRALCVLALAHLTVKDEQLPHSITIMHSDGTSLTVSASNEHEYRAWKDALQHALALAGTHGDVDTELTAYDQDDVVAGGGVAWSGWLSHVCWHRAASLGRDSLHRAMTSHLSGYLLRKFKNSHGWQKLWVVFAAFALYFYKSWQDDAPLASLPLLGYTVGPPTESDSINKEFVFKLQFKNHIYFFRADSQYTYDKWTDILRTAMIQAENNNLP